MDTDYIHFGLYKKEMLEDIARYNERPKSSLKKYRELANCSLIKAIYQRHGQLEKLKECLHSNNLHLFYAQRNF